MKTTITLLALILLTILCSAQSRLIRQSDKPRLIVMADIDAIGEGKSTEGSELIIRQVTKDDPRPVFFVVNAGSSLFPGAFTIQKMLPILIANMQTTTHMFITMW